MVQAEHILEYKCPCCGAGLRFSGEEQNLTCEYCDNTFELEAVRAYNEETATHTDHWEVSENSGWSESEDQSVVSYTCPSCGGVLMTDEHTAATFCPYCGNPTVLPGRLSGGIRPAAVIPFQTTLEDAKQAFLKLCKNKPLLPKEFTAEHRLEKSAESMSPSGYMIVKAVSMPAMLPPGSTIGPMLIIDIPGRSTSC